MTKKISLKSVFYWKVSLHMNFIIRWIHCIEELKKYTPIQNVSLIIKCPTMLDFGESACTFIEISWLDFGRNKNQINLIMEIIIKRFLEDIWVQIPFLSGYIGLSSLSSFTDDWRKTNPKWKSKENRLFFVKSNLSIKEGLREWSSQLYNREHN